MFFEMLGDITAQYLTYSLVSTVFVMRNINGVGIASTWATTEYPILAKKAIEFIYEIIGGI